MEEKQIARAFRRMNRMHRSMLQEILEPYGLYLGQHRVLFSLQRVPSITQKALGERLEMKKETLSVSLRRMEQASLLIREVNPLDKREKCLYLTKHGEEIASSCRQHVDSGDGAMFACFNEVEMRQIADLFETITGNIASYKETLSKVAK